MSRRSTRLTAVVLGVLLVAFGSACSKREDDAEAVRDLLEATKPLAHRFVYAEETDEHEITVQGVVQDDLRAKYQLTADGAPVAEQVVVDDAVAMRFLDEEWVQSYIDNDVATDEVEQDTDVEGVSVLQALFKRYWVADPAGAPPLITNAENLPDQGVDPIGDARNALDYVADIVDRYPVVKYDPESISPVYRSDEDPFPVPEDGSGVDRYDVVQFSLPSVQDATSGATPQLPNTSHFRKMAIYAKGGRIIRVMETIDASPRVLDDLRSLMLGMVKQTAPENVYNGFVATAGELEGDELAAFLLDGLNSFIELRGDPPIRFRTMTLELRDLGDDGIEVALPKVQFKASLALLHNLGRKPLGDPDEGDIAAGGATSTTTSSTGSTTQSTLESTGDTVD